MSSMAADAIGFHAANQPDKLAIYDYGRERGFSYAQLERLINDVAAFIVRTIGPDCAGQRIAVIARNSVDVMAVMYAANRLGAIFLPLNWRLSPHETAALTSDCTPVLSFYQPEFAAQASAITSGLTIEITDDLLAETHSPVPEAPATSDQPLIILYTSGTTGTPKGVIITRQNALSSSENFASVARVTQDSVLLCDNPLFHTMGLIAISRTTLQVGATLYLSPVFSPDTTLARLSDPALGITHYFCVPQMTQMMRQCDGFDPEALRHLVALFVGGAPLSPELAARWQADNIRIINGYGMSETGTAIHMDIDDDQGQREKPSSIGKPAPLIEVSVRDSEGHEVPDGQVGEAWLRGPNVSLRYWTHTASSAESFSGEWYRSGDAVIRDPEGYYTLVGRFKDMYISGGENVYPAEIEGVIADMDGVREVAVVGIPDDKWGEIGVAVVQCKPDAALDEARIIARCRERLAHYKAPKRVTFVEDLPRLGSGKINKTEIRKTLSL